MAKEGCDKNCATCDIGNRAYCAVQLGLKNQELLMNMQTIISGLIQVLTPILTPGSAPIQSPYFMAFCKIPYFLYIQP